MRALADDLPGQFLLCRSESHVPLGWATREAGGWVLASHPKLPVIEVGAADSEPMGWVLGYPIHPNGRLLSSGEQVSFGAAAARSVAEFERSLYAFGGRFVAVYLTPQTSRVYLDPCGALAVVFCNEEGIVASSPVLVPYSEKTKDNVELIQATGIPERDGWYPFGLTPRHGIERLMPNHYLDLTTWQPIRHWPTADQLTVTKDISETVSKIASILERNIAAITTRPVYMSLTSGHHTRMLLACGRPYLDRISFFTIPLPHDAQASLDCDVARRLAKRFGLDYVRLRWEAPSSTDLRQWLYRTGACVAGRTWRTVRTLWQLDPARGIFSGISGSIGQPNYRHAADFDRRPFSVAELLHRISMPAIPEIYDRTHRWLSALPVNNPLWVLDFVHLEQKGGCWAGPQEYGHVHTEFILSPYCHREIVQLMLSLPHEYRWRKELSRDLLRSRWPELLELPFNSPVGLRRGVQVSRRMLERAVSVITTSNGKAGFHRRLRHRPTT